MALVEDLLDRIAGKRILIAGDCMLDRYIWGEVERISPEAPVQVVRVAGTSSTPGGAGNTARNVVALGARATVVGLAGGDEAGEALRRGLEDAGIEACLLSDGRPTTVKTRVVARNQQLLRIDQEDPSPVTGAVERKLLELIDAEGSRFDAAIISDYAKGVVSARVVERAVRTIPIVAVDPTPDHVDRYRGATLLTPNHVEASRAAGILERDEEDLGRIGRALVRRTGSAILITRGEKGMMLFPAAGDPIRVPTVAQEVVDVVGAGDTVVAVATLALAAGAPLEEAVRLANEAAGIVVSKVGTAVATSEELRARLRRPTGV